MKILIAAKKSSYELAHQYQNEDILLQLKDGAPAVAHLVPSHEEHSSNLEKIRSSLKTTTHSVDFLYRDALPNSISGYDVVLSAGGDGTVLDIASRLNDATTRLLSINSAPGFSVGFLCALSSDTYELIPKYLENENLFSHITRLNVKLDGVTLRPVLNDMLICHQNPAASSKYRLGRGADLLELTKVQKNSGIWISTAAGSTAAMLSAGGEAQALDDNRLQFKVREPYLAQDASSIDDHFFFEQDISVLSSMRRGKIFLDGPHTSFDFAIGSKVELSNTAPALRLSMSQAMLEKRARLQR